MQGCVSPWMGQRCSAPTSPTDGKQKGKHGLRAARGQRAPRCCPIWCEANVGSAQSQTGIWGQHCNGHFGHPDLGCPEHPTQEPSHPAQPSNIPVTPPGQHRPWGGSWPFPAMSPLLGMQELSLCHGAPAQPAAFQGDGSDKLQHLQHRKRETEGPKGK